MATRVSSLQPGTVHIGWRARTQLGDIEELAESIRRDGQLQPIVVAKNGTGYNLIAGHRRLEACRLLKTSVQAQVVDPHDEATALWLQIVENIQRVDFTAIELGEALSKHKELYAALHTETQPGATGRNKGTKADVSTKSDRSRPAERYTKVVAADLGVGETKVVEAIKLATVLSDEQKDKIRSLASPKDRRKAERKALSTLRKRQREEKLMNAATKRKRTSAGTGRFDVGDMAEVLQTYAAEGLEFDLALTDPPYELPWGTVIEHDDRESIGHEAVDWDKLDLSWVSRVKDVLSFNATVIAFCPAEAIGAYAKAFEAAGLEYRGALVWYKTNPGTAYRQGNYIQATEYIVRATRGQPYFKPFDNAGSDEAHNVLRSPICGPHERLGSHPAQKPKRLINQLLDRHAMTGQRVLDPFAGVGSVPACCKRRNIWSAGIEIDPKYAELAQARLQTI